MKDLLSNEEIDTLLDLFRTEGLPPEEARGAEGEKGADAPVVTEVDLLKPNRFSRDQMRNLERLFEGCAKALAASMSDKLRLDMFCDCVAVEQIRFHAFLKMLTAPAAIYVLRMPPFEVPVLFTVTTGLLYGAVDRILGGTGRVTEARQDFTAAEYTVADAFVGPCLDRVTDTLSNVGDFSWSVQSRFCNPSLAQIMPAQDVLLTVHFQVSSEYLAGDLRLAVPFAALEPFLQSIELGPTPVHGAQPGAMRGATAAVLRGVPLSMAVLLGETDVALRQLLRLQIGDVVPLRTRLGDPLVAPVQGRPKFHGQVGRRGNQLAFQVGAVLES